MPDDATDPPETPAPEAPPAAPVLELPAAPRDLRPSPHAIERAELHEVLDGFTERAREGVAHVGREGGWRMVLRGVGVIAALVLCLRLAFDDALPRIVLGACGAAVGVAAVAIIAHAWAAARRRRSLLDALDLLTRVGNANPEALPMLAPQIASLVESLRADDKPLRPMAPHGNNAPDAQRSD